MFSAADEHLISTHFILFRARAGGCRGNTSSARDAARLRARGGRGAEFTVAGLKGYWRLFCCEGSAQRKYRQMEARVGAGEIEFCLGAGRLSEREPGGEGSVREGAAVCSGAASPRTWGWREMPEMPISPAVAGSRLPRGAGSAAASRVRRAQTLAVDFACTFSGVSHPKAELVNGMRRH